MALFRDSDKVFPWDISLSINTILQRNFDKNNLVLILEHGAITNIFWYGKGDISLAINTILQRNFDKIT